MLIHKEGFKYYVSKLEEFEEKFNFYFSVKDKTSDERKVIVDSIKGKGEQFFREVLEELDKHCENSIRELLKEENVIKKIMSIASQHESAILDNSAVKGGSKYVEGCKDKCKTLLDLDFNLNRIFTNLRELILHFIWVKVDENFVITNYAEIREYLDKLNGLLERYERTSKETAKVLDLNKEILEKELKQLKLLKDQEETLSHCIASWLE